MAGQVANTFETFDAVGNREELANTISRISPEETPFLSLIGTQNVKTTHPEWQTDTLATPDTTNNRPEGNDWSYDAVTATTRIGNYTQISDKTVIISGSQEDTDKAGRASEVAYQVAKKGVELKTDQEVILLSNQASSAGTGNGATNRTSAGMPNNLVLAGKVKVSGLPLTAVKGISASSLLSHTAISSIVRGSVFSCRAITRFSYKCMLEIEDTGATLTLAAFSVSPFI